jgi:tetratricopeptide (TPR) repeat protein
VKLAACLCAFGIAVTATFESAGVARADTPPGIWDVAKDPPARARWQLHVNVTELFMLARKLGDDTEGLKGAVLGRARGLLEEAHAADSPDVTLRFDLGMIYYELERHDLAVRILEPAVAMAPDSPGAVRALESLAFSYAKLDRPKEERRAYERYLAVQNDVGARATTMLNLAECMMRDGDLDEAVAEYEEAYEYAIHATVDLGITLPLVVWGQAVVLDRAGERHEALAKATFATQLDPGEAIITRHPSVFFVPAYEREWYLALGATVHANEAKGGRDALARWTEVEGHWQKYVAAARADDRWLPIAKAHLARATVKREAAERAAAKERSSQKPKPPKAPPDVRL